MLTQATQGFWGIQPHRGQLHSPAYAQRSRQCTCRSRGRSSSPPNRAMLIGLLRVRTGIQVVSGNYFINR